jgi:hypothetical protein
MRGLTATALLDVWERGRALTPVRRAFALLQAACPETLSDVLMTWTVGQRDAHLFTLRERSLGPDLEARTACPTCVAALEMKLRVADVCSPFTDPVNTAYSVCRDGQEVHFRLPTLRDLDEVVKLNDAALARQHLLQACILKTWRDDAPRPVELLSEDVLQEIERQMALADPQADVRLDLTCAACGYQWQAPFDIAAFLWNEIQAYAQRLLREVHQLASAHGWSEADILALSPLRRFLYLEMVCA